MRWIGIRGSLAVLALGRLCRVSAQSTTSTATTPGGGGGGPTCTADSCGAGAQVLQCVNGVQQPTDCGTIQAGSSCSTNGGAVGCLLDGVFFGLDGSQVTLVPPSTSTPPPEPTTSEAPPETTTTEETPTTTDTPPPPPTSETPTSTTTELPTETTSSTTSSTTSTTEETTSSTTTDTPTSDTALPTTTSDLGPITSIIVATSTILGPTQPPSQPTSTKASTTGKNGSQSSGAKGPEDAGIGSQTPIGAAVGGALGGIVAFVAAVCAGIWFCFYRKNRRLAKRRTSLDTNDSTAPIQMTDNKNRLSSGILPLPRRPNASTRRFVLSGMYDDVTKRFSGVGAALGMGGRAADPMKRHSRKGSEMQNTTYPDRPATGDVYYPVAPPGSQQPRGFLSPQQRAQAPPPVTVPKSGTSVTTTAVDDDSRPPSRVGGAPLRVVNSADSDDELPAHAEPDKPTNKAPSVATVPAPPVTKGMGSGTPPVRIQEGGRQPPRQPTSPPRLPGGPTGPPPQNRAPPPTRPLGADLLGPPPPPMNRSQPPPPRGPLPPNGGQRSPPNSSGGAPLRPQRPPPPQATPSQEGREPPVHNGDGYRGWGAAF